MLLDLYVKGSIAIIIILHALVRDASIMIIPFSLENGHVSHAKRKLHSMYTD